MTKFFTSDLHFNHTNLCRGVSRWDNKENTRNFPDLHTMNRAILDSINDKVGPQDELYILGDFAMGPKHLHTEFLDRIHCEYVYLIHGNHDQKHHVRSLGFSRTYDYLEVPIQAKDGRKNKVVCFHYYIGGVWNNVGKGWFHLFGHSHGSLDPTHVRGKAFDIGWDVWMKPLSEHEVFQEMDKLEQTDDFIDHHTNVKSSWSYS